MLYCITIPAACKGVFSHFCTTSVLAVGGAVCYTDNNYGKIQKPQEEMTVKQSLSFARRLTALVLAAVMLCVAVPAAFAEDAAPGATTIGGANTTLIPEEEENCLSWLFGSKDKITLPYLNIKGKGLRRNLSLDLVDCLVGITYTELGSIGSYVSAGAAQEAWKAQAVAIHSYLEYHKQYGSSANALIYTPVEDIPSSARSAIRKAVESVKDEVLTYNGSVIDAVWSASAGYNTQTGVYGTCSSLDAWGSDVPYLKSVESPYERQYHEKMRRVIGKDYDYVEYNDSRTGVPERQRHPGSYPELLSYYVDTAYCFCDRMFHLYPGVHLYEIKVFIFIHYELHSPCAFISGRCRRFHCRFCHLGPEPLIEAPGRRLFQHLLISPLYRTISVSQLNYISKGIAYDLYLYMPRV